MVEAGLGSGSQSTGGRPALVALDGPCLGWQHHSEDWVEEGDTVGTGDTLSGTSPPRTLEVGVSETISRKSSLAAVSGVEETHGSW